MTLTDWCHGREKTNSNINKFLTYIVSALRIQIILVYLGLMKEKERKLIIMLKFKDCKVGRRGFFTAEKVKWQDSLLKGLGGKFDLRAIELKVL